jgi:mannitol-1-phosphate 5-dehydrogenase
MPIIGAFIAWGLQKLRFDDRLIGPAIRLSEKGICPKFLAIGIAEALLYDWSGDLEASELQERIGQEGVLHVLSELSGLQKEHVLLE